MQVIGCLLNLFITTCFGHHYAHRQENKTKHCRIWCSALLLMVVVGEAGVKSVCTLWMFLVKLGRNLCALCGCYLWSWGEICVHIVDVFVEAGEKFMCTLWMFLVKLWRNLCARCGYLLKLWWNLCALCGFFGEAGAKSVCILWIFWWNCGEICVHFVDVFGEAVAKSVCSLWMFLVKLRRNLCAHCGCFCWSWGEIYVHFVDVFGEAVAKSVCPLWMFLVKMYRNICTVSGCFYSKFLPSYTKPRQAQTMQNALWVNTQSCSPDDGHNYSRNMLK
jgi:hypothetical protein